MPAGPSTSSIIRPRIWSSRPAASTWPLAPGRSASYGPGGSTGDKDRRGRAGRSRRPRRPCWASPATAGAWPSPMSTAAWHSGRSIPRETRRLGLPRPPGQAPAVERLARPAALAVPRRAAERPDLGPQGTHLPPTARDVSRGGLHRRRPDGPDPRLQLGQPRRPPDPGRPRPREVGRSHVLRRQGRRPSSCPTASRSSGSSSRRTAGGSPLRPTPPRIRWSASGRRRPAFDALDHHRAAGGPRARPGVLERRPIPADRRRFAGGTALGPLRRPGGARRTPTVTFEDKSITANITCVAIRPGAAGQVVIGHSNGQVHVWKWEAGQPEVALDVLGLVARRVRHRGQGALLHLRRPIPGGVRRRQTDLARRHGPAAAVGRRPGQLCPAS